MFPPPPPLPPADLRVVSIDSLKVAMAKMEINVSVEDIIEVIREVEEAKPAEQIAQATEQIAQATEQIAQATEQIAQATKQIAQATKQIAQATEQIAQATKQIAQATKQIAQATERLSKRKSPAPVARLLSFNLSNMLVALHPPKQSSGLQLMTTSDPFSGPNLRRCVTNADPLPKERRRSLMELTEQAFPDGKVPPPFSYGPVVGPQSSV